MTSVYVYWWPTDLESQKISKWPYLCNSSSGPLYVWF